eukprot:gene7252-9886_t
MDNSSILFISGVVSIKFMQIMKKVLINLQEINYTEKTFSPYSRGKLIDTVVVDCTHPTSYQLTHHLKEKHQKKLINNNYRGDTSTDAVLNSIKSNDEKLMKCNAVTSNHFDIDSFLSVWSVINPYLAVKYEEIIRCAACIGDFRELRLYNNNDDLALRLVCWLNSVEKKLFYKPFDSPISMSSGEERGEEKFEYFLIEFSKVLEDPDNIIYSRDYMNEYNKVIDEYNSIENEKNCIININNIDLPKIQKCEDIGLVIICWKSPLHYYSLFSQSIGFDIVLSCYTDNRYEVELKYTTMIDLTSRSTLPRVEMIELAKYLNIIETNNTSNNNYNHNNNNNNNNNNKRLKYLWHANRITDSGPLLRLEEIGFNLSKVDRYGHPYERPIFSSSIDPKQFQNIVKSYFYFAYYNKNGVRRIKPKYDWIWVEYHDFNQAINWNEWNYEI